MAESIGDSAVLEEALAKIECRKLRIWWQGYYDEEIGNLGPFMNKHDVVYQLEDLARSCVRAGVSKVMYMGEAEPEKGVLSKQHRHPDVLEIGISY